VFKHQKYDTVHKMLKWPSVKSLSREGFVKGTTITHIHRWDPLDEQFSLKVAENEYQIADFA